MSFNLGDWARQLQCEMCATDPSSNLAIPPDALAGALPGNFWDVPPDFDQPGYDPDTGEWDFDLPPPPDYYPSPGMIDGTPMINFNGIF
jgi:hypothetical protein